MVMVLAGKNKTPVQRDAGTRRVGVAVPAFPNKTHTLFIAQPEPAAEKVLKNALEVCFRSPRAPSESQQKFGNEKKKESRV